MLKALLLHTADECGGGPGPDYRFGWGLLNVAAACAVVTDNADSGSPRKLARMKYGTLENGQMLEFPVSRTSSGPIKVTLSWTDRPGQIPQNVVDPPDRMLRDDLDLRIVAPGGFVHQPWKLNPSSPANAATRGDNDRDNVEQVVIDSPVGGTYKIRVSYKGSLPSPVDFAMVTDNVAPVAPVLASVSVVQPGIYGGEGNEGVLTLDKPTFFPTYVTLSDNSTFVTLPGSGLIPAGQQSGNFNIASSPCPSDRTVTLTAVYSGTTRTVTMGLWGPNALKRVYLNKSIVIGETTPLGATIEMNHPARSQTTVSLSSNSANMIPPASVVIQTGDTEAKCVIGTTKPSSDHTATLTATHNSLAKTSTVKIITPPLLTGINLPPTVVGGANANGRVYFNKAAPTGGILIPLSDNKAELITPATALIPGHQWSGGFVVGSTAVVAPVTATISATYRGTTKTDTIRIDP